MLKRKRKVEGGIEREVVVLSGEVELLVESQSWAGAAAKLRQKTSARLTRQGGSPLGDWVPTKYLEYRTLQIQSKPQLRIRRRAADGSRYEYWPWTANSRLLHRGPNFALQALSCTRLNSLRLRFSAAPGSNLARKWGRR